MTKVIVRHVRRHPAVRAAAQRAGRRPQASVVTVNSNFGDVATFDAVKVRSTDEHVVVCAWTEGTDGAEPTKLGSGPKPGLCNYDNSSVTIA